MFGYFCFQRRKIEYDRDSGVEDRDWIARKQAILPRYSEYALLKIAKTRSQTH